MKLGILSEKWRPPGSKQLASALHCTQYFSCQYCTSFVKELHTVQCTDKNHQATSTEALNCKLHTIFTVFIALHTIFQFSIIAHNCTSVLQNHWTKQLTTLHCSQYFSFQYCTCFVKELHTIVYNCTSVLQNHWAEIS